MTTRELVSEDFQTASALMTSADGGCRFDQTRAAAFWRRWMVTSTILGTFDDAGVLYSLRVLDRTKLNRIVRLRAQFHRDANQDAYTDEMKRSVRGFVAWLRATGITQVLNLIIPPGQPYPGWLVARLGAVVVGDRVEFTTDALEQSLDP